MEESKLKELAHKFLKEYVEFYKYDLKTEEDREMLLLDIERLEALEVETFFSKNGIDILDYSTFLTFVEEEAKKLTHYKEIASKILDKLDWKNLSQTEKNNIVSMYHKMTRKELQASLKLGKNFTEEEIENLKRILLDNMEEKKKEPGSDPESTEIITVSRDLSNEKSKLKELAYKFLKEYIELYKYDLKVEEDREKLVLEIENLEAIEVDKFFSKNGINILDYSTFLTDIKEALKEKLEAVNIVNITPYDEIISKILDKLNWNNLSQTEKNNIFGMYCKMTKKELQESLELETDFSEEKIENLRSILLDKMEEKKKEPASGSESTEIIPVSRDLPMPLFKGLSNDEIDQIIAPFLERINDDNYSKIESEIIKVMKETIQTDYDEETVEVKIKNRLQYAKLSFYQKMIQVFNELDYDHLTINEKVDLAKKLQNGEILIDEICKDLNLSQNQIDKIKETIIETLKVNHSKKFVQDLIQKYIKKLKEADYSYYELVEKNLTKESIKSTEFGEYLADSDIEVIINTVKEEGKKIAFEKMLELPEVKTYIEKWNKPLKELLNVDIDVLEQDLAKWKESKEMLGLTDFNKNLLIEQLEGKLKNTRKLKELITSWKTMIAQFKTEEIMPFYENVLHCDKSFLGCERYKNEVFETLKIEVLEELLQELTKRIIKDMKIDKSENLDKLIGAIDAMKPEDFDKYKIPENMQEEMKNRLKSEIKKVKKLHKVKMDQYLDINTSVVLAHEVNRYEYEEDFMNENNDEVDKVKAGKRGKIKGYIIKKGSEIDIVSTKEELKEALNNNYQFAGYEFEYRNFLRKHSIFVKESDLKIKKQSFLQTHWKKFTGAALIIAILGGAKYYNENKSPESSAKISSNLENFKFSDTKESETTAPETEISVPEAEVPSKEQDIVIPDMEASFTIPESANDKNILYNTMYEIGNEWNSQTALYKSGTVKGNNGIVLESPEGIRAVYQDTNEIINLLNNENYKYIGVRAINEYSYDQNGNIIAYEGFYGADNIDLLDASRTLTRTRR